MSDYTYHTALEVTGPFHQVQRIFEAHFSPEPAHQQCDHAGPALDLDMASPVPAALKGTDVGDDVRTFHALHLLPPSDIGWLPFVYREAKHRRVLEARLEALHPRTFTKIRHTAVKLHREMYTQYGAIDERGWSRRFRGCDGNTFWRRGGRFDGDERGVTLRCSFNTEFGWPRPVLEQLAQGNPDLEFWAEVESWAAEKLVLHGIAGYTSVRQVMPPLPEHAIE
jgi:hypothetical protein